MEGRTEDTEPLILFLRRRGCEEKVLNRLKDEKIDCKVLLLLKEDKLREYIPSYGDRIAAVAFARSIQDVGHTQTIKSDDEVISNLKRKLVKVDHLMGNKHAKRNDIRVDLGWFDFDKTTQSYKQVRRQNGGGKRSLKVPKLTTKHDLLDIAKQLFFPNGISKRGLVESFEFELKDFDINEEMLTLEDFQAVTKLKPPININLYSVRKLCSATGPYHDFKNCELFRTASEPTCKTSDVDVGTSLFKLEPSVLAPVYTPTRTTTTLQGDATNDLQMASEEVEVASVGIQSEDMEFVDTGTPTVSFRVPALQAQTASVQFIQDTASERVDSDDDDVQCIEQPLRRKRLSLSLPRPSTSTSTCSVSEDNDIAEAIKRSLEDEQTKPTFEGIISSWIQKNIRPSEEERILIHRARILRSTSWAIEKPNFSFEKTVHVTFSGEIGADSGGPKREFFRELLKEIEGDITTGLEGNKVLKNDVAKLHTKTFEKAGKLIAWSILQGGPGFPVLNDSLYSLMTGADDCNIDLGVVDLETKTVIQAIQNAVTEDEMQTVLKEHFDWLIEHGMVMYGKTLDNKEEMTKVIFKNAIYYRTHAEVTQFMNGLETIGGLFSLIMEHPKSLKRLFVTGDCLSFTTFRELYTIKFSDKGSNRRAAEEDTIFCFEAFLMESDAGRTGISLEKVLGFWTGAARPPPLGFPQKPEIAFVDSDVERLPVARTCGMVLELARGSTDLAMFTEGMRKAITWSGGFHLT